MRRVIVLMSVSLDGYAATEDHDHSWLFPHLDDEAEAWIVELLRRVDTTLIGRVNYEEQAAFWPSQTGTIADLVNAMPKVVFSRTLASVSWQNSWLASGDLAEEVARLRAQPGGDMYVPGGAGFIRALSAAGLVDEYRLIVHPVVLGSGLPLFPERVDLKLLSSKTFQTGAVALCYEPVS